MFFKALIAAPAARPTVFMACLFGGLGVSMPFLPRWLEEARGLSGLEIGAILSAAPLARIVVGPLIAAWADGFDDRRRPLILLALAALGAYGLFATAEGFWGLFALGFAASAIAAALSPLIEGMVLRAGQTGILPYGAARAIGSAAFIIGNVVGGAMVARLGVDVVIVWLLASFALTAASGLLLKPDPAPAEAVGLSVADRLRIGLSLLKQPRFLLAVAAAGLIQSSHAFYYSFSPLVWRDQGLDGGLVGLLWAFGVIVEIGFLALLPQVERRFGPEALIVMGGLGAVVRWSLLAFTPPAALLWPIQALHALTFAASHVGALKLVFREAPASVAGLAQTMYAALASGTLIGLATLASGALYDAVGAGGYFAMAAMAMLGLLLTPPLFERPRSSPPHGSAPLAPQPGSSPD